MGLASEYLLRNKKIFFTFLGEYKNILPGIKIFDTCTIVRVSCRLSPLSFLKGCMDCRPLMENLRSTFDGKP